jgi:hypothetical protein
MEAFQLIVHELISPSASSQFTNENGSEFLSVTVPGLQLDKEPHPEAVMNKLILDSPSVASLVVVGTDKIQIESRLPHVAYWISSPDRIAAAAFWRRRRSGPCLSMHASAEPHSSTERTFAQHKINSATGVLIATMMIPVLFFNILSLCVHVRLWIV